MINKLFFSLALILLSTQLRANSVSDRIDLEKIIHNQIQEELSKILPESSYTHTTGLKMEEVKEKVVSQGTSFTTKKEENAPTIPSLPGFTDEQTASGDMKKESSEKQEYEYHIDQNVKAIHFTVTYDEALEKSTVQLATKVLQKHIEMNFGQNASMEFIAADLKTWPLLDRLTSQVQSLDNPMMAGLIILSTLLMAALILKKKAKVSINPSVQIDEDIKPVKAYPLELIEAVATKNKDDIIIEIISEIYQEPLVGRMFLNNLDENSKKLLQQCFPSGPNKKALQDVLGIHDESNDGIKINQQTDVKIELANLLSELRNFRYIYSLKTDKNLGILTALSVEEMAMVINEETPACVGMVLAHLPKTKAAGLLQQFSKDQQKEILMAIGCQHSKSDEDVKALDLRIRSKIKPLTESTFSPVTKAEDIMGMIVAHAKDTQEILTHMHNIDENLFERYQHYLLTFDDLLNSSATDLSRYLENLDNETIALSFMGVEKGAEVISSLPRSRKKIINSMMMVQKSAAHQDITSAREKALTYFRQAKREERSTINQ